MTAKGIILRFLWGGALFAFLSAWWINSRPEDFHKEPGQWERVDDEQWSQGFYRTVLPPSDSVTVIERWTQRDRRYFFNTPLWEAELGRNSIEVSVEGSPKVGYYNSTVSEDWRSMDIATLREHEGHARFTIKNLSDQRQTFRILLIRLDTSKHNKHTLPTYSAGICLPAPTSRCAVPLTPTIQLPTLDTVNERVRNLTYAGAGLAALATLTWIGWVKMLLLVWPARAPKAARRQKETEDLEKQLAEVLAEKERIKRILQDLEAEEPEEDRIERELEAAVDRVKELREKLRQKETA